MNNKIQFNLKELLIVITAIDFGLFGWRATTNWHNGYKPSIEHIHDTLLVVAAPSISNKRYFYFTYSFTTKNGDNKEGECGVSFDKYPTKREIMNMCLGCYKEPKEFLLYHIFEFKSREDFDIFMSDWPFKNCLTTRDNEYGHKIRKITKWNKPYYIKLNVKYNRTDTFKVKPIPTLVEDSIYYTIW